MRNDARVYSIILVHNNADVFPTLYKSLKENTQHPITNIIIDNGSTDRGVQYMDKFVKKRGDILLRFPENIGVSAGWNAGLRYIRNNNLDVDYVAFINSDIEVGENWLNPMVGYMEGNSQIGMVDNVLVDPRMRGFIQSDGPKSDRDTYKFPYKMTTDPNYEPYNTSLIVEYGTMACCLFRYKIFEEIGLFDENFFIYSSDFDMQIRMKLAGFCVGHCVDSKAYHRCFHTCKQVREKSEEIKKYMSKDGQYLKVKWSEAIIADFKKTLTYRGMSPLEKLTDDGYYMARFPEQYEVY